VKVSQLSEIVWEFFQKGRAKATGQTLRQPDIAQMIKLNFGNLMRQRYIQSQKLSQFGEADYSFLSPVLAVKRFPLSDPDSRGMRRADMGDVDLYRLPNNAHFTNMYPVGESCLGSVGEVTQVKPGEESFYQSPDFSDFKFFVVKGRGIDTYNLPHCVKHLDIETTYDLPDFEITDDIGFEIASNILGLSQKIIINQGKSIDNSFTPNTMDVKQRLEEAASAL
jgi:hypothetical protein